MTAIRHLQWAVEDSNPWQQEDKMSTLIAPACCLGEFYKFSAGWGTYAEPRSLSEVMRQRSKVREAKTDRIHMAEYWGEESHTQRKLILSSIQLNMPQCLHVRKPPEPRQSTKTWSSHRAWRTSYSQQLEWKDLIYWVACKCRHSLKRIKLLPNKLCPRTKTKNT